MFTGNSNPNKICIPKGQSHELREKEYQRMRPLRGVGIMAHYWNGGYTIEKVAHYWNGGYTIEIVTIIFLYKLISSSFVIISSHTSYTSLNRREKGSRVKEES